MNEKWDSIRNNKQLTPEERERSEREVGGQRSDRSVNPKFEQIEELRRENLRSHAL